MNSPFDRYFLEFVLRKDFHMAEERSSIIISVFSTTPGIGKTVTAINLTAALAQEGYKVCLVDLDLQFGDVLNYLQLSTERTIAKAQRTLESDVASFHVKNFLITYRKENLSFAVLAPPRYLYDSYQANVSTIESIVKQLTYFDFVVLDLNSAFSALNLAMLDISTIINYIGVIDFLPAVKNFKIGYDTLIRFNYEESKIRLIENRADSQKLINGHDVERLIGEKFYHRLPNDFPAVSKSINLGMPLIFSAPESRLTRSFYELTGKYTNRPVLPISSDSQTKKGLFARIISTTADILFGKRKV